MKIAVIGLGVGYALSCALAEAGIDVIGLDTDANVVKNPRRDKSVEMLFAAAGQQIQKHLQLTGNYEDIRECDLTIVCVSTGDEKKLVLGHVEDAVRSSLRVAKKGGFPRTILVYSTLPFGGSLRIKEIFKEEEARIDEDVFYCHMPLMIAQGTTARDFVNPPFIAFGSYAQEPAENMRGFYLEFIRRSSLFNGKTPPSFVVSPEVAELAKLFANAFLSTKISFSNMVSNFCEANRVDGKSILRIVGSDCRIGQAMLGPGYAFGGACFPRDLDSLIDDFREDNLACPILDAVKQVNAARVEQPLSILKSERLGNRILVLGTSYKAGILDARNSPGIMLAELLRKNNYEVATFDPNIETGKTVEEAIRMSAPDVIVITTREPEFAKLGGYIRELKVGAVIDYAGDLDSKQLPRAVRLYSAGSGWLN